jgi:hypothetical protein
VNLAGFYNIARSIKVSSAAARAETKRNAACAARRRTPLASLTAFSPRSPADYANEAIAPPQTLELRALFAQMPQQALHPAPRRYTFIFHL